eukprot:5398510-Prymnesium_polylepis.1
MRAREHAHGKTFCFCFSPKIWSELPKAAVPPPKIGDFHENVHMLSVAASCSLSVTTPAQAALAPSR